MADELAVWLYDERVAIIDRHRGRPRLAYTGEALRVLDLTVGTGDPTIELAKRLPGERRRFISSGLQLLTMPFSRPRKAATDLACAAWSPWGGV